MIRLSKYQEKILETILTEYRKTGEDHCHYSRLIEMLCSDPLYLSTDMADALDIMEAADLIALTRGDNELFIGVFAVDLLPLGKQYFIDKDLRKKESRRSERRVWIRWLVPLILSAFGAFGTLNSIFRWIEIVGKAP